MKATAARQVPCPNCRRPAEFAPSNRWRPFCSERCRSADLGAWASESYRLPAPDAGLDADGQAPN
ncbi:MAG: DNA gyrase inhibitor YacG [Rubrivivax sp.]|nr:DNA gyrase inhibitor YacG [Rubrivivax sp.]